MAENQPDWLTVSEARATILGAVAPLSSERLPLEECVGRVLAEEVRSPVDLPPWDNSGMDGFAARADDVRGATAEDPVDLRVIEDVPAGAFPSHPLSAGTATRVMTGAPVPEGADSVIRVEHSQGFSAPTSGGEGRVRIVRDEDAGRNIRRRGEDLQRGEVAIPAGSTLRAASIGVAASVGRTHLSTYRRPLVAVASSGNELVEVDGFAEVLEGRKIVASNGYSLAAQLREAGMGVRHLGIAPDDPVRLREHLLGARGCDALVTSAGVSVGEHDHTRAVLDELGLQVEFWRVRMKPGSPLAFGRVAGLGGIPWFGLPGNPVSAMVTFELFVRPALLRMAGHRALFPPVVHARLEGGYQKAPGLTHFPRARLRELDVGYIASLTGAQGSGILTSMATADALVVVPEAANRVESGGPVKAIVLGGAPLREVPGY